MYIDITGHCNAQCHWCPNPIERKMNLPRGFMEPAFFEKVLDRLEAIKAISPELTYIALFNWGEPALHKKFPEFTQILTNRYYNWTFSTNASVLPALNECNFSRLHYVIFSMPGFSQESYDRIHGFDFKKVLNNIDEYRKEIKRQSSLTEIRISYHVYQFNLDELPEAQEWAKENGFYFNPHFAQLGVFKWGIDFLKGTLSPDILAKASEELFLFYVKPLAASCPQNYECPQFSIITLDEFGNVLTCCSVPRSHSQYKLGSVFEMSLDDIESQRKNMEVCNECLKTGAAYCGHNVQFFKRVFSKNSSISTMIKRFRKSRFIKDRIS